MRGHLKSSDFWVKLALLLVFGAFYVAAIPYPEQSRQFPQLLAVVSVLLTLAAIVIDFVRKEAPRGEIAGVDDTELTVLDADARRTRRKRYYQTWAVIIVAALVGVAGGFLFSALCLFAGYALVLGSRARLVHNLVASVAMTILVYVIFGMVMKVPLLDGAIG